MMRQYFGMLANVVLYVAMIIAAIVIYNVAVNPLVGWGTFGEGELLPAQAFIVLVLSIVLCYLAYKLKYKWMVSQTPPGFIRMQRYLPISTLQTVHMVTVGIGFAFFFTAALKLLLHLGVNELASFTDQYSDVPAGYLIVSAVINTSLEIILFMGILFNEVRRNGSVLWAVILVSIIIAALQPGGLAMQLLGIPLGLLYGYMYIRLRSIWSVILIGCSFNVLFFSFVKTTAFDWFDELHDGWLIVIIVVAAVYMSASVMNYASTKSMSNL
ncbi:CPBP family intramembrane glutamic endopeptidase [Paenibacillus sp. OV219]|uniref:CPBP family intramembrane glutamic endopeptidase n=1 Tax=Paenibacillus sp. OV219 TaxID=1884377 RepID=UPI0008D59728|nr:CPBP family intramembrane glutamic endopeptidase [Paenibacillus sp. OV219]SEN73588.1 CAAX protease self-immunity [Paenibacillus sp. OV219]